MPVYTPYPPQYKGESDLLAHLARLDDGALHIWHSYTPPNASEVDLLLWDERAGLLAIEVKALPLAAIEHLDLQTMRRRGEGERDGPSPFKQALAAARGLAAHLDRKWPERPFVVPAVAFPLVSRAEWTAQGSEALAELAPSLLLREDLADVASLRDWMGRAVRNPIAGAAPRRVDEAFSRERLARLHETLVGGDLPKNEVPGAPGTGIVRYIQNSTPDSVASILGDALAFLHGPARGYADEAIAPLAHWAATLAQESSRLRASVVGEFKAGKSTLINAIYGRDVCFVDVFEATATTARFTAGAPERAVATHSDGRAETWTLDEYVRRARARALGDVEEVVVSFATGQPFDLVDTPGLGTRTESHEARAEREVRSADVVIWTVDASDVGSAREGAFLMRAREVGLPIITALTKSDELGDEVEEILAHIAESFDVDPARLLAISALKHRETPDAGVTRLVALLSEMATEPGTRSASREAKLREVRDNLHAVLARVLAENAPHVREIESEFPALDDSARKVRGRAQEEWRRLAERACDRAILSVFPESGVWPDDMEDSEERLKGELSERLVKAMGEFQGRLGALILSEWKTEFDARIGEFDAQIRKLSADGAGGESDLAFLRENQELLRSRSLAVAADSAEDATLPLLALGTGAAMMVLTGGLGWFVVGGALGGYLYYGRRRGGEEKEVHKLDPELHRKLHDVLLQSCQPFQDRVEETTERFVNGIAVRSLARLFDVRSGGERQRPTFATVVEVQKGANDLVDRLMTLQEGSTV